MADRTGQAVPDAEALIRDGLVQVDRVVVTNPDSFVETSAAIVVGSPPVLKGQRKLRAALDALRCPPPIAGRTALDVGAAHGGFTTELLERGAGKVYAVDVGVGSLLGSLRQDSRVHNLEGVNAGSLNTALVSDEIDVAVFDVSYSPLAAIVPQVTTALRFSPGAHAIALVKPMFELQLGNLPSATTEFEEAIERAAGGMRECGWIVTEVIASPLAGNRGAKEFVICAARGVPHAGSPFAEPGDTP